MTRGALFASVALLACCAPRPIGAPTPPCPADTAPDAAKPGACTERMPVSRGAYRACVEAGACVAPPFSAHLAWGADHAAAPMPPWSVDAARAYCAWAGRRLHAPVEPLGFRCVADRGAPARAQPPEVPDVAAPGPPPNTEPGLAALRAPNGATFSAVLLDDDGTATCGRLRLERTKAGAALVLLAHGKTEERRHPFELRAGTLRFSSAAKVVDDWLVGSSESFKVFVGGSPWLTGDLACTGAVPALRPVVPPGAIAVPTAQELADPSARRRFLAHEDRVLWVREPDVAGAPGRCVRAGFDRDDTRPRRSATLRIEARASERFYLVSDYLRQGKVFVSPVDERSARSGLLLSGLLSRSSDADGWHLGPSTLYLDEARCKAAGPRAPEPPPEPTHRHAIVGAWSEYVRTHHELYWVDPSGAACERVEVVAEEGFPLLSRWTWTPGGVGAPVRYDVTVDADGVFLRTPTCTEHAELEGLATLRDGFRVGGSTLFETRAACEAQRTKTHPFVHRCPAVAARARPGPLPTDSLAAHGGFAGFLRDGLGQCGPSAIELSPSWNVVTTDPALPSLEGVWRREGKVFDVYEWPWTHTLFGDRPGPVARRADGGWAVQFEVLHPTLEGCKKAGA